MAGARRGPLKINKKPHLGIVPPGTVAQDVQPNRPVTPESILDDPQMLEAWERIVPDLVSNHLIIASDGPALELCIHHYVHAIRASISLSLEGYKQTDERGIDRRNPTDLVMGQHTKQFLEIAKQLGMTFMSRARTTSVKDREDEDDNPFSSTG